MYFWYFDNVHFLPSPLFRLLFHSSPLHSSPLHSTFSLSSLLCMISIWKGSGTRLSLPSVLPHFSFLASKKQHLSSIVLPAEPFSPASLPLYLSSPSISPSSASAPPFIHQNAPTPLSTVDPFSAVRMCQGRGTASSAASLPPKPRVPLWYSAPLVRARV
jgi:hypothetical protein